MDKHLCLTPCIFYKENIIQGSTILDTQVKLDCLYFDKELKELPTDQKFNCDKFKTQKEFKKIFLKNL